MSLQTRIDKLETSTRPQRTDGLCTCVPVNTRVIYPGDDERDEPRQDTYEWCGVCGGERQIIRVVYVVSPRDLEEKAEAGCINALTPGITRRARTASSTASCA